MGQNRHSLPLSVQLATCNSPWMTECLSFDWVKKVLVKVNQDEAFHCFYAAVHFKFFQNTLQKKSLVLATLLMFGVFSAKYFSKSLT